EASFLGLAADFAHQISQGAARLNCVVKTQTQKDVQTSPFLLRRGAIGLRGRGIDANRDFFGLHGGSLEMTGYPVLTISGIMAASNYPQHTRPGSNGLPRFGWRGSTRTA